MNLDSRYEKHEIMPYDKQRYALLYNLTRKKSFSKTLDCGCATGTFSKAINSAFKTGIDGSEKALSKAALVYSEVYLCDLNKTLPLADKAFDLVWAGETIEHIYDTDLFVKELYRVMSAGGTLILSTPNLSSLVNRICLALGFQPFFTEVSTVKNLGNPLRTGNNAPAGHIRIFTARALKELLTMYGFKKIKFYGCSCFSKTPIRLLDTIIGKTIPTLGSSLFLTAEK